MQMKKQMVFIIIGILVGSNCFAHTIAYDSQFASNNECEGIALDALANVNESAIQAEFEGDGKKRISSENAISLAINNIEFGDSNIIVNNPHHKVVFSPDGISFIPRYKAPEWNWLFSYSNIIQNQC